MYIAQQAPNQYKKTLNPDNKNVTHKIKIQIANFYFLKNTKHPIHLH